MYRPNAIVSELLYSKNGYEKWSIQMKTYFIGEDLWDIVEADEPTVHAATNDDDGDTESEIKAWRKNNAVALHAIQISCQGHAFTLIQNINSAKIAWDTLAANFAKKLDEDSKNPKSKFDDSDDEFDDDEFDDDVDDDELNLKKNKSNFPAKSEDFHQFEPLLKAVKSGDWKAAKSFLAEHPEAVRASITCSDKNALHVAVAAGHFHIVEKLVQLMTEEDLLMQRNDGFTALAIAIEIGNTSIAECLFNKNKKLLRVHVIGRLPVVYAVLCGQTHMAPLLYSVTPLEDLMLEENAKQGSELISLCIQRKHFDIALNLLEHCPRLATTAYAQWKSPVVALAKSAVLASLGQLNFWQRWIYNCIQVPDCAKNHVSLDVQNINDSQCDKDITVITSAVFQRFGLGGPLANMVSFLLKHLGVKHIYEVKLDHVQALELLTRMSKVIETTWDLKLIRDAGVDFAMTQAVYNGNVEFIKSMAKANPELVWTPYTAKNIFSLAIQLRQTEVFSLIYGLHNKEVVLANYVKPLPQLPKLPPMQMPMLKPQMMPPPMPYSHPAGSNYNSRLDDLIPGPALQLQKNLQWDQEVDTIFPQSTRESCINGNMLSNGFFIKRDYKNLVMDGEKWIKDISRSCIVVAALIVTIMFISVFILCGGNNNQDNAGVPVLVNRKFSKVFIISDALSLFSSTIAVLVFLGILTSRYAKEDFLISLPTKMIIGLSTLLFSIATMMIAFSAALSTMLHQDSRMGTTVIFLSSIPVTLSHMWMHFPLLVELFMSTYGPSIFNRNAKPWF
ncbi:uncharacterized protein LOC133798621 [Humulus lupulus]|uniref:uncharacterized protein LOC133798621 n=1 Tax=Humulus lupulus TaxID=3486 RepID=UPI002B4113B1|nr:uncharacterized protein LOC133798621 [Humulus lupulus]